jgi:hypothetical protein
MKPPPWRRLGASTYVVVYRRIFSGPPEPFYIPTDYVVVPNPNVYIP